MGRVESCGIREFFVISIGWSENELGHADRVTLSVRVCVMQVELPKMSIFCLFGQKKKCDGFEAGTSLHTRAQIMNYCTIHSTSP